MSSVLYGKPFVHRSDTQQPKVPPTFYKVVKYRSLMKPNPAFCTTHPMRAPLAVRPDKKLLLLSHDERDGQRWRDDKRHIVLLLLSATGKPTVGNGSRSRNRTSKMLEDCNAANILMSII